MQQPPMPPVGKSRQDVLQQLRGMTVDDLPADGRAYGYFYNAGAEVEAIAHAAAELVTKRNGLDPTMFPSLKQLENQVIAIAREHLRGDDKVVGTFTSGGTESCMLAVKTARDFAFESRGRIERAEIILPSTAHAAFHKGAHYLDLVVRVIDVDPETFAVRPEDVEAAINDKTVLIVGSAPGYGHGVIDPIAELGRIALKHKIPLHVDGCIGAFYLPFLRKLGEPLPDFDFTVPGVSSISMDLHKYAYAPKGASVLLYKDATYRSHQYFACAKWTGYSVINSTIQGTKSGGPLAGAWAVLNHLGEQGYLELTRQIHAATTSLLEEIPKIEGLRILGKPAMGLIAIASDDLNVFQLADELTRRRWYVQPQFRLNNSPANIHLLIEPSNAPFTDAFLRDLREAVAAVRAAEPLKVPPPLQALVEQIKTQNLTLADCSGLLGAVGAGGGAIDNERALLNTLMDQLPSGHKEILIKAFASELYR